MTPALVKWAEASGRALADQFMRSPACGLEALAFFEREVRRSPVMMQLRGDAEGAYRARLAELAARAA